MKRILITGANSYIGTSFEKWVAQWPEEYHVDTVDTKNGEWKKIDFSLYEVVFHVAAVVHQKERPGMESLYFSVNRDLPIEIARKAKSSGTSQFIFMSTMAVYGLEGKIGENVIIDGNTSANPKTLYGVSKFEAESELNKLTDEKFKIVVARPPMVYGPNCPGNYARLERIAVKLLLFPMIDNRRSMLHIDKLCDAVKEYIDNKSEGLRFPQDNEYVNTSILVRKIAEDAGKKMHLSICMGLIIKIFGKKINFFNKVFGNLMYEEGM